MTVTVDIACPRRRAGDEADEVDEHGSPSAGLLEAVRVLTYVLLTTMALLWLVPDRERAVRVVPAVLGNPEPRHLLAGPSRSPQELRRRVEPGRDGRMARTSPTRCSSSSLRYC